MTCIFTITYEQNHEAKVVDSKNENELLSIDGLFFVADKLDIWIITISDF